MVGQVKAVQVRTRWTTMGHFETFYGSLRHIRLYLLVYLTLLQVYSECGIGNVETDLVMCQP
jgi:hypothetical protein